MALLQTTIDDDVKKRADEVFARSGLTSAMAVRVMVTQVANTGVSPLMASFSARAAGRTPMKCAEPWCGRRRRSMGSFQTTHKTTQLGSLTIFWILGASQPKRLGNERLSI